MRTTGTSHGRPKLHHEMQPAKLNVFSPTSSLPTPASHFSPQWDNRYLKTLSKLLFLGRLVWKGPPTRLGHKVAFENLTLTHSGWLFQLFSAGRGLELCSQLGAADALGRTRVATGCAAGEAPRGSSTARAAVSTALPGECVKCWGNRTRNLCHL